MDVWLTKCKKTVSCSYCLEDITTTEPMVAGKLWLRQSNDGNRFTKQFRWHAKRTRDGQCCWLVEGLEYLSAHPAIEHRGRKRLVLPAEIKERRLFILRQRARLVQKLKLLVLDGVVNSDLSRIMALGEKLESLRANMVLLGGVPKSWE